MQYEPVIGLEVHAELLTRSKMYCACAVVDSTVAEPNRYVCPVCAGMPGTLPVINQRAIEFALRVALALNCEVAPLNVFARKNYFYPDLPKGYQISQYELPLARNGFVLLATAGGERRVRIRRVHLEEDTGKLFHIDGSDGSVPASLVDLNRAGVPLLEIVTEPDITSVAELEAYAKKLRSVLRYLGVNNGDMEKGVIRFEANISVRAAGTEMLNKRTEIKNLNSFRALVRGCEHELARQTAVYRSGGEVQQQTLGWNETRGETYVQRSKEQAHDYRYFPEPDLPPVQLDAAWLAAVRSALPELPDAKLARFRALGLNEYDAEVLVAEQATADYFDAAVRAAQQAALAVDAKAIANWISSQLFGLLNNSAVEIDACRVPPAALVQLINLVQAGSINAGTGKQVLKQMFETGATADAVVVERGLAQVNDSDEIRAGIVAVIAANAQQVAQYLSGKDTMAKWFFGQAMRALGGQANPALVQSVLDEELQRVRAQAGA